MEEAPIQGQINIVDVIRVTFEVSKTSKVLNIQIELGVYIIEVQGSTLFMIVKRYTFWVSHYALWLIVQPQGTYE
ncbi:hypothetical protein AAGF08_04160 [Algoriphagus sp. SE2]|uniref:hypothetical protein n=1 Tax=Algoriphagus sp. SE2 TaxID=3141536 RepID=UPI0031CD4C39